MRKVFPGLLGMILFGAVSAAASGINLDLNVHLGDRAAKPLIVSAAPLFLESATLGLQVSVGTPDAIFHGNGRYFLFRHRLWLVAPSYEGPWRTIRHDRLPPGLARRNNRDILALRQAESERYKHGHYHGRTFRPGKAGQKHGRGRGHWHHGRK